jgi:hypothetical protein
VLIYYAFVWICNYVYISKTYATVIEMHKSPQFYLTIFLCVGFCFMVDLFITSYKFNFFTTPTDFLRTIVAQKKKITDHTREFEQIFAKIRTYYVSEDIKREQELEVRRE